MKFAVFVPNSRRLSLILAKLVHELGTRTHCDTLHDPELVIYVTQIYSAIHKAAGLPDTI